MRKRWRSAAMMLVLILVLGAVRPASAAEATPHTFWDVMEVVKEASGSVVGVITKFPPAKEGGLVPISGGTGVVYREDGYIVTNAHVVYGATEVSVLMPDGKTVKAAKSDLWFDYVSDVAVIRLPGKTLKAPAWADSDQVKVGQLAIAVGNPLGFRLGNTVTVGVVSGLGRSLGNGYPFLQHDAAINGGNSGGPLLDADGQVVGINSSKIAGAAYEGLSFAIPANVVKSIADTLIKDKKIARVWLGLSLNESGLASYGLPTNEGLEVARVYEDAPSAGHVNKGDILERVNGKAVHTLDDVSEQLKAVKAGQTVRLSLKRDGTTVEKTVTAAEMPNEPLDYEDESLSAAGVWRNMTEAQVEQAVDDGYAALRKNFNTLAEDYIQKDARAAVFFQTEYMHVLWSIWGRVRSGEELTDGFETRAVREVRGKFEVMLALPLRDTKAQPQVTVTLEQGDLKVPGILAGDGRMSAPPDFWPLHDISVSAFSRNSYRFDSTNFDLTEPVTVHVKTSEGLDASYTFYLEDMR